MLSRLGLAYPSVCGRRARRNLPASSPCGSRPDAMFSSRQEDPRASDGRPRCGARDHRRDGGAVPVVSGRRRGRCPRRSSPCAGTAIAASQTRAAGRERRAPRRCRRRGQSSDREDGRPTRRRADGCDHRGSMSKSDTSHRTRAKHQPRGGAGRRTATHARRLLFAHLSGRGGVRLRSARRPGGSWSARPPPAGTSRTQPGCARPLRRPERHDQRRRHPRPRGRATARPIGGRVRERRVRHTTSFAVAAVPPASWPADGPPPRRITRNVPRVHQPGQALKRTSGPPSTTSKIPTFSPGKGAGMRSTDCNREPQDGLCPAWECPGKAQPSSAWRSLDAAGSGSDRCLSRRFGGIFGRPPLT